VSEAMHVHGENFPLHFTAKFATNFTMFGDNKLGNLITYQILSLTIGIFEI